MARRRSRPLVALSVMSNQRLNSADVVVRGISHRCLGDLPLQITTSHRETGLLVTKTRYHMLNRQGRAPGQMRYNQSPLGSRKRPRIRLYSSMEMQRVQVQNRTGVKMRREDR